MGPMVQGFDRRKVVRLSALALVALFTWSFIAAPSSSGDTQPPQEPASLSAYYTFGDAVPIAAYADLEAGVGALGVGLPAFGPALAHTFTEVGLPSQASADGFLTDFGIANTINGTVTGTFVPTEASARQPGGDASDQFTFAGGPIGNDRFARAAAGVVRVSAESSDAPNSRSTAYFNNVYLLPGSGAPPEPPGSYNPDDTFPGGPGGKATPDPGPKAQTAILSINSISSNSQSIREGDTASSFGVAEVSGIAIGNRTAENVCSQCFTIDALRVEAYARTNGQPGGSRAAYRVFIGRACYRSSSAGQESDQCIGKDNPGGEDALTEIDTKQLNGLFSTPIVIPGVCEQNTPCVIAIKVHAGTTYTDPSRPLRASNPPEDPCRNYAYPDSRKGAKKIPDCEAFGSKTGPDRDQGQEAKAVGEGINIDITTLTLTQLIPPNADLDSCFQSQIPDAIRTSDQYQQLFNTLGCPIGAVRQVRDFNLTLGQAVADAVARPAFIGGGGGGGGGGTIVPPVSVPPVGPIGGGTTGSTTTTGSSTGAYGGGGGISGPLKLHIDWSSLKIKPWKARDLAKGLFAGGIIAGMVVLIRRRLKLGGAG